MLDDQQEIGGYFEFSLPNLKQFPYPQALKYISARSAFLDLLDQNSIKKVWMPKFICDSMIEPLLILDIDIRYYDLDENFYPKIPSYLESDAYLVYVNYFGLCTTVQKKLLSIYPSNQIIFDHSQAFFVKPFDCFATIYSLRKFLPVAEGGLLISKSLINANHSVRDLESMIQQYHHCFVRRLSNGSRAYEIFKNNEVLLNNCIPKNISGITEEIINCVDYASTQSQRLDNFKFLHTELVSINKLEIDIDSIESPLTYPLLLEGNISKELIEGSVYTPTYWFDSLQRLDVDSFEYKFISNTTHIVCDQRYSCEHMQFQVDKIMDIYCEYKR
ncbi:hypothetical protein [Psychrobacter immobilis]|uniref:hypothetical protein n=1 Tax=Psychrobacter immobilis TaxID=498 RepID=UPI00191897B2|nr:hypothetical protein [Psychrobacter immobilis]